MNDDGLFECTNCGHTQEDDEGMESDGYDGVYCKDCSCCGQCRELITSMMADKRRRT